jgi:hypothetical protein
MAIDSNESFQCPKPMSAQPPTITSLQCVDALRALGYEIEKIEPRFAGLRRADGRRVLVERHKTLSEVEIRVILFVADVTREAFDGALAARLTARPSSAPECSVEQSGLRDRAAVLADVDAFLELTKEEAKKRQSQ